MNWIAAPVKGDGYSLQDNHHTDSADCSCGCPVWGARSGGNGLLLLLFFGELLHHLDVLRIQSGSFRIIQYLLNSGASDAA